MRIGTIRDVNYESDTIEIYGPELAEKHFAVDRLIELALEAGVSVARLKSAIDNKDIHESHSILETILSEMN